MSLEAHEAAKYTRMWERAEYRRWSPGESCVERAISALSMTPGDTVNDYGCGTGRASFEFKRRGFWVRGIDHARNCLDVGLDVPLTVACLWDLPESLAASDFGFCCDVMEHIPPEKVDDVLSGIARRTEHGAFFRISTVADGCGKLIGETLHLTVQAAEWWVERVDAHMKVRRIHVLGNDVEIITGGANG